MNGDGLFDEEIRSVFTSQGALTGQGFDKTYLVPSGGIRMRDLRHLHCEAKDISV